MANIGYATMQVIPSLRGMDREINRQLGPQVTGAGARAGTAAGRGFSSRFTSALSGVASRARATLEGGLTAAAGVVSAGVGAALTKGFSRVTAIEDATAALTISLGDASRAGELLGDVLDVIRGTPYNLDQFATAAQRMAGMGIEARKIPGYLRAIGEASATQGARAGEYVDRLVRVFGQVAAQGRLMGEDVLQMSETGVNALAILGNHFGKTTSEMRDMVSEGAVPAREALDILAEGILNGSDGVAGATVALGGTMESLRGTLRGAIGGFGSALARFGAAIIDPLMPVMTRIFTAGSELIDGLGERISNFGSTIEERFPIFNRFFDWVEDIPDHTDELVDGFVDLTRTFAPLAGAIAGLAATNLAGVLGPIGMLIPSIGPLGGMIAALVAVSPELRDLLIEIGQAAGPLVADLVSGLQPALVALQPVVVAIATALGDALLGVLQRLTPLVPLLAEVVIALGQGLATLLPPLVEAALTIADALLPAVQALLPAIVALAPVVAGLAAGLASLVAAAPPGVIQAIAGGFLAFRGVRGGIRAVRDIRENITSTLDTVRSGRQAISGFFAEGAAGGRLKSGLQAVGRAASSAIGGIRSAASALAGYARSAAVAAASALRTAAAWVAQRVASIATTAATWAMTAAQTALNVVMSLNPIVLVVLALAGLVAALVIAYQKVDWFRNFVNAAFRAVLSVVQGVINWIRTNWPLLLAILTGPIGIAVLVITRNWDRIKNGVTAVKDWIVARFNDLVGFIRSFPGHIASAASGMWDGIKESFRGAINAIIRWWNNLRIPGFSLDINLPGPVPDISFSWGGLDLPNIPTLHTGGIFNPGQDEGLALLQRGEGVFTRDQMAALGLMANTGRPTVVQIDGNGLDRRLLEWLRHAIRTEGGDVQVVLGAR